MGKKRKIIGKETKQDPSTQTQKSRCLNWLKLQARGRKRARGKKKGEDVVERIAEKKRKAAEQAEAQKNWFDLKVNTSVYVTGLPDDVDEGQLAEVACFFLSIASAFLILMLLT